MSGAIPRQDRIPARHVARQALFGARSKRLIGLGIDLIDRTKFFDGVRLDLFGRTLQQSQVEGLNAILARWDDDYHDSDSRWLAYALGTAHHETDHTMQPVEEYDHGGPRLYANPDPETGCCYYGRGFVQLTHRGNYAKAGDILGIDLVRHPELSLQIETAATILLRGMIEGWFTGARLSWYFTSEKEDWWNARRIVNGLDRAELVAGYAKAYHRAIVAAKEIVIA